MSLIYEALRKSEEQRRLGELPTLSSPAFVTMRRRRRSKGMLAIAALALVALVAGAWWLGWATPREAAPIATTQTAPAARVTPVPARTPELDVTAAGMPRDVRERARAAAALDDEEAAPSEPFANSPEQRASAGPTLETPYVAPDAALPEPLPDLENDPAAAAAASELEAEAARARSAAAMPAVPAPVTLPPAPAAAAVDAPRDIVAVEVESVGAEAPPTGASATAAESPGGARSVGAAAQTAAPPAPAVPAATQPVPFLFELGDATRRALPPLKLNMHVYAPEPARRFVIVDGTRAVEGGTITSELEVVEIRADGVVLAFRGERFLLPRAGG